MNYLKQFLQHINNVDYSSFLSLWEEYCLSDEADGLEIIAVLEAVKKSALASPFGRHVENILPLWEQLKNTPEYARVFELIIDLETTNTPDLAELTFAYLKKLYGTREHFNEMIRLVGLRERQNFQGAVSHTTLLAHMKKGNFVFHTGGWGVGEIIEVSFVREQLTLEFDYVSGTKDMSFQNAFSNLRPIPETHFLARRFGNPDVFEHYARKHPVETIHMLLKDLGPKTAAEIKEEMCNLVIPESDWGRFWQTVRAKLRKDTMIDAPTNLRDPFRLRTTEITPEAELQAALEGLTAVHTIIHKLYLFFRDYAQALKKEEFRKSIKEFLIKLLSETVSDAEALQIHFFLEDLSGDVENTAVKEMVRRFSSIENVIKEIEIVAMRKRLLNYVQRLRDDWTAIYLSLLISLDQATLRDFILTELLKANEYAAIKVRLKELIDHPASHPGAFLWYIQKVMEKEDLPYANPEGKARLFEAFLILLNIVEKSPDGRDMVKKMHLFLTDGRFANVRKIFSSSSKEYVQEFLLLATKCHSIEAEDIRILHSLAHVAHPSLKSLTRHYDETPVEEEMPLWITEEGYRLLKEKIHQIATVETVQNASEIEEARALGDLRENAEFKAALEKRDRLQADLKALSDQFGRARILTKDEIDTTSVNIGVTVTFRGGKGNIHYTLLGPFEANVEKHILSFQSKLAQAMLGKKVGENVDISGETYTIEAIRNAL